MSPATCHNVLVVDDDFAFRWAVVRLCQKREIEADIAEDGREAVELIERNHGNYCCVVLDLSLPRVNGREVLDHLHPNASNTPYVAVVTGYAAMGSSLRESPNASLIRSLMVKPVDPEAVVTMIEQTCTHGGAAMV